MKLYSKFLLSFLFLFSIVNAQNNKSSNVSGTVLTSDGKPVPFVSVRVLEANHSTETDENGKYKLNLSAGQYTIRVSYIGLKNVDKNIQITTKESTTLDFVLNENAAQLEEVIISSGRRSNIRPLDMGKAHLNPLDNPQSVGIVSSQVIQDQQASRLGDIVKNVSGVSLTQQRQGVAETFSARGYSIGIAGAGGSIFKNGVLVNTMGFPEASALESVEVMKGSSAMLYGNVSGGVIINMVTKKPKFTQGGEVAMRYGSYNYYKPSWDIYGPISKNIAYRFLGTYENAESYRDQVKSKRIYVNPSLLFNMGAKTSLLVEGDYLNAHFTPDNGIGILNQNIDPIIPASRSRFINTVWAYYHLNQGTATATLNHQLNNNWKFNVIGAYAGTGVNTFGTNVPMTIASTGKWIRGLSRVKTNEQDYTGQANLNGHFNTGKIAHQLLFGSDFVRVVTKARNFKLTNENGSIASTSRYDSINVLDMNLYQQRSDMPNSQDTLLTTSPVNRFGVYAQDLISLTSKFKILAGLRWSTQTVYQTTIDNLLTGVQTRGKDSSVSQNAFSPKVALIYQPLLTTSVYVSYANNFTVNTGYDVNYSALKPSIIKQYEVGVKNILFDGKLTANLSVYRIRNNNFYIQAYYQANGTTVNSDANMKQIGGETTSDGFDVDFNGFFAKNFYFIAGYGYNNMRYTKTDGLLRSPVLGEQLINNPRHTANGTIFYTLPTGTLRGLKLGVASFYTGKRMGGLNNTIGQTPAYNRLVPLSGFATLDISAGYTYRKISLLAKLSNITNTLNYLAHDRYSIMPIPPRQFMATLSYKF